MPQFRKILTTTLITLIPLQPILQAASSLPTGGTFTAGSGKITTSGNVLTINQNSLKGIIDWNSFSIGTGSTVTFHNGAGATLNRVTGTTPTTILGQLLATGNIYLLNPEGILIGRGATVHTGGDFLATTLNIPNSSFLSNAPFSFAGSSQATVVNLGDMASTGGSIYLIGNAVTNSGHINTPNGTTALAAGSQVVITDTSSNQKVAVLAPGGDVTNSGFLTAAQIELKTNGGNIYALAGNNGGQIQATGTATQNGHVWLIASNGTTNVSGNITATNSDGTGGDIETSGAHVLTNSATIKTGKNGNWLLDPDDLTINSTLAGTIETTLNNGTNVTEQTTASGTGGNGDITVANNIAWTGSADLTLSAYRGILFNPSVVISNTGSGNLTLRADNASTGTGTVTFSGVNQIDFSASTGNVALLYDPTGGYTSPTSYTSNFVTNGAWTAPANQSVSSQFTAYMLVNNATDLQNISTNLGGTYALGTNINASSITNFIPIGYNSTFTGIFDGQGHTISNLTINDTTDDHVGLFAVSSGILRNVNLIGESITGTYHQVGGLVAVNNGTIANVSSSGVISSSATTSFVDIGGLVGYNEGIIFGSSSSASITVSSDDSQVNAGGLSGINTDSVSQSFASGTVTINAPIGNASNFDPIVGGLVGCAEFNGNSISNSYASGAVTVASSPGNAFLPSAGGLVGLLYNGTTISNSYATGSVSSGTNVYTGGLVGYGYGSNTVSTSYATGAVSAATNSSSGGLFGYYSGGTVTSSYWDNTAAGTNLTVAAGNSATITGASGEATSLLQSGTLPAGFSSSNWIATSGFYPLLTWQEKVVSGDAYNGTSPLGSVTVDALANGVNIGSAVTNANGFYTFYIPSVYSAGVLTYLPGTVKGNTFSDLGSSGEYSGMNIYAGTLTLMNQTNTTYSGILAALNFAIGSNSGTNFLFSPNGSNINLSAGTNLSINSQLALNLDQTISTSGAVTIAAQADLTQTQPITAASLSLTGSGNITLGQANRIGTLSATAGGNLAITHAGDLTTTGITAGGTAALTSTTGNLTIASGSTVTANGSGTALQLSTGNAFLNLAGSGALNVASGGGRWLVSSQNPASDTDGGLAASFKQYGFTGTVAQSTGNGFLYTVAPILTVGLTGTTSKTYDGTTSASLTASNFAVTGAIDGDNISLLSTPILGSYADPNAGGSKPVSAGGFSLSSLSISNGSAAIYGYQLASTTATGNIGTINPATLTYTATPATQTFGSGNTAFTGSVTGFVNGETLASATTGTAAFTSTTSATTPAGTYGIFGSGLSANHGNYTFTQASINATALNIIGSAPPPTAPGQTTLTVDINNATAVVGQTPTFNPTYVGSPTSGLNITSLLSGLTYQITPSLNGPGTYTVTASGIAPSGYSFSFVPGTLTLIDNSPVTLPSLTLLKPDVPSFLPESEETSNFLQPANSVGRFQIDSSGTALSAAPNSLAQTLFFSGARDKSEILGAGAKP
jgi:filamentous hemagglutinin family protein